MKFKLMIQSLSPLFLLTIIRNFNFKTQSTTGIEYGCKEFLCENIVLISVMAFCSIWIVCSLFFILEFRAFKYSGKKHGYTIVNVKENKEASLNFLLTLIVPLLIDDVDTLQGTITFLLIVVLICVLLYRTTLFYDNPVLSILGYHIYTFEFEDKSECAEPCVGVCRGEFHTGNSIEFKRISNNVYYMKEDVER